MAVDTVLKLVRDTVTVHDTTVVVDTVQSALVPVVMHGPVDVPPNGWDVFGVTVIPMASAILTGVIALYAARLGAREGGQAARQAAIEAQQLAIQADRELQDQERAARKQERVAFYVTMLSDTLRSCRSTLRDISWHLAEKNSMPVAHTEALEVVLTPLMGRREDVFLLDDAELRNHVEVWLGYLVWLFKEVRELHTTVWEKIKKVELGEDNLADLRENLAKWVDSVRLQAMAIENRLRNPSAPMDRFPADEETEKLWKRISELKALKGEPTQAPAGESSTQSTPSSPQPPSSP